MPNIWRKLLCPFIITFVFSSILLVVVFIIPGRLRWYGLRDVDSYPENEDIKDNCHGDNCHSDVCGDPNSVNQTSSNELMIRRWKEVRHLEMNDKVEQTTGWFQKGCPLSSSSSSSSSSNLNPRAYPIVERKEYRTLSWKERQRFHQCLILMTQTPAVEPFWDQSEYDSFVTQHRFQFSPEAHGSPAFLPYHRVYLFYFEKVLRSHEGCEGVGLPYWDTTLDSYLPDPSSSAMFTDDSYIGNSKGEVNIGFLAKTWSTVKLPTCIPYGVKLTRTMCSDRYQMMSDDMINEFINCPQFESCVFPQNSSFEENHGLIHGCMGGHMKELVCSPYDPMFYMHHSFIDLIFELYLAVAFPSYDVDASIAYPADSKIDVYYMRGSEPMRPFDSSGLKVRDGMSRNFTRDFYTYQLRPHYCTHASQCRSRLLWCDVEAKRCKAKAGEGGDCTGLPNEACYCRSTKERPYCSSISSKCECFGTGTRPKTPAPKATVCAEDKDCSGETWCYQNTCEKKKVIGEECGILPDGACSTNTSLELTGDRSLKPCRGFEKARCLLGRCSCTLPNMRCEPSKPNCTSTDPGLWCDPSVLLCAYRGQPGTPCYRRPHGSCGGCNEGELPLCSKKSKKCVCVVYDDVAEKF